MCGITGYCGKEQASNIIISCLKRLEYRGYDSMGIATSSSYNSNNTITTVKEKGKISEITKKYDFSKLQGNRGIGHTRWATNGPVTQENSHPHISYDKKVHLVHNGIIENYQELRTVLEQEDIKCATDTDTEVIAHLIAMHIKKLPLQQAIHKTINLLEGSFAIVFLIEGFNHIFFAKKESPLIVGKSKGGMFIASDISAFIEHTKTVMYIEDEDYGYIDDAGITLWTNKSNPWHTVTWDVEQAKKGHYHHYMLKEIHEQKTTITKAILQPKDNLASIINCLQKGKGIFFVGCGTSYHAALSASYLFTHIAQKHVNVVIASEFSNYNEFLTSQTVMVAISQSGETADVLDAVKSAKLKGVTIIALTNVMGSTLTRVSDYTLFMNAGPEISVLSTKSYTSQLALLTLLAYGCNNNLETGKKLITYAQDFVAVILEKNTAIIKEIAQQLKSSKSLFIIGRDLAYPTVLEAALKIKEVSYIHAEGFPGGELKHGTIALIENGTPCIALLTKETERKTLNNAAEIKSRGGYIIGVSEKKNEIFDKWIELPYCEYATPIVSILPFQLLAYYLACAKNLDPDKPRNLAKSVTVK